MKKENVPQDDENVFEGTYKVVYAIDKDGNYQQVPSKGWEPENVALNQAWEVVHEKTEEARKLVLSGKVSPLAYHMEKNMMTTALIAEYMGISPRKVRKHLEPRNFKKLSIADIDKYAYIFRITKEEFLTVY